MAAPASWESQRSAAQSFPATVHDAPSQTSTHPTQTSQCKAAHPVQQAVLLHIHLVAPTQRVDPGSLARDQDDHVCMRTNWETAPALLLAGAWNAGSYRHPAGGN